MQPENPIETWDSDSRSARKIANHFGLLQIVYGLPLIVFATIYGLRKGEEAPFFIPVLIGVMQVAGWCTVFGSCRSWLRKHQGVAISQRIRTAALAYVGMYYLLYLQVLFWMTPLSFLVTMLSPLLLAVWSSHFFLRRVPAHE